MVKIWSLEAVQQPTQLAATPPDENSAMFFRCRKEQLKVTSLRRKPGSMRGHLARMCGCNALVLPAHALRVRQT